MNGSCVAVGLGVSGTVLLVPSVALLLKGFKKFPTEVEAFWSLIGLFGTIVGGGMILLSIILFVIVSKQERR